MHILVLSKEKSGAVQGVLNKSNDACTRPGSMQKAWGWMGWKHGGGGRGQLHTQVGRKSDPERGDHAGMHPVPLLSLWEGPGLPVFQPAADVLREGGRALSISTEGHLSRQVACKRKTSAISAQLASLQMVPSSIPAHTDLPACSPGSQVVSGSGRESECVCWGQRREAPLPGLQLNSSQLQKSKTRSHTCPAPTEKHASPFCSCKPSAKVCFLSIPFIECMHTEIAEGRLHSCKPLQGRRGVCLSPCNWLEN